ncbi:MAG: hypothetical protein SFV54_21385 [Bryobacteraceae bacterium]|nr:hypothetical protein [Bryobacteraceae bacterium]
MKLILGSIAVAAAVALPTQALAQGRSEEHRAEVSLPDKFDTMRVKLKDLPDRKPTTPPRGGRDFEPGRPDPVGNSNPSFTDPLAATGTGPVNAVSVPTAAATNGTPVDPAARVAPPDTTGDIGPNHYVQWVNLRYSVYTLTRDSNNQILAFNLVSGFPKNGNAIWQGFGGRCESDNDGDPIVQYDQLADRWVLTQFAVSAQPYTQCVAVSTSPDPTGTYHRYAYSYGREFPDFPKLGVWPNAYYITYNMFRNGRTFTGARVCAFERAQMLAGGAARQLCASTTSAASLLPADLEGTTLPLGTANPLLAINSSQLLSLRFTVNWATAAGTLTAPAAVPGVAAFSRACGGGTCIPQPGTTRTLDSLGDRLNYRLSYRNFGGQERLLVNHAVTAANATGIRWYVLTGAVGQNVSTATPVISQQGTYAPTSDYRWMGSAAMDKTGGIAIGYNVSNATTIRPSIRYAYRGPSDPVGTLGGENSILVGTGSQTGTLSRWGDYSTISVDPVDGCQMVFTTQYIPSNGSFNWSTYIASFKLNTCN